MRKSRGASWRIKPKVDRSWLNNDPDQEEVPALDGEEESPNASEPPPVAREEIEQLSERVRNLGEATAPTAAPVPAEIEAAAEDKAPQSAAIAARAEEAPAAVVMPPSEVPYAPPSQAPQTRPHIPAEQTFKPNIPTEPPTQRIAERLAQQRIEMARTAQSTSEVRSAIPVADSRSFHPEISFKPGRTSHPAERVDKPIYARTETAKPPAPPPPLERVAEKIAVPVPVVEKVTPPEPPAAVGAEMPVEAKFEPPSEHYKEEPVQAKIKEPIRPRYAERSEEPEAARVEPAAETAGVAEAVAEAPKQVEFVAEIPKQVETVEEAPKQAESVEEAPKQAEFVAEIPKQAEFVAELPKPVEAEARKESVATAPPPSQPRDEMPRPRPLQRPAQPAPPRERSHEPGSGFTRVVNAVRSAMPVLQRLLPLLEGNVTKAVTNLLTPPPTTAITPAVQKVDLAPVERGLVELHKQQRELSSQIAEQNQSIQRVEQQLGLVRTATDRNTLEQQELIEEMQKMEKRQSRFATIFLILLLLSLAANVLLYLQYKHWF